MIMSSVVSGSRFTNRFNHMETFGDFSKNGFGEQW